MELGDSAVLRRVDHALRAASANEAGQGPSAKIAIVGEETV
jgi:hypothetical protein